MILIGEHITLNTVIGIIIILIGSVITFVGNQIETKKFRNESLNSFKEDDLLVKLVIMRHGQSLANKNNIFTGWNDVPLTAEGELQAHLAGKKIIR